MTALVLVGHGAPDDELTNRPVYEHAETIRQQGEIRSVREAFLKAEPRLGDVLAALEGDVVVVPLFATAGYFVSEVLPEIVEQFREELDIRYTEPVGTHEWMADVIRERAESVVDNHDDIGLALVGHGSEHHTGSTIAVRDHAARIRDTDTFAAVTSFFIEEPPYVEQLPSICRSERVVVVPVMMSDGHHVREDVPEQLGIENGDPFGGRDIEYTAPVGTHPRVADIALDRATNALTEPAARNAHTIRSGSDVATGGGRNHD